MKHLMHQDAQEQTLYFWEDLPDYAFFRFLDDCAVYRTTSLSGTQYHYDIAEGFLYTVDNRPVVEVELFRVARRESVYKDKEQVSD